MQMSRLAQLHHAMQRVPIERMRFTIQHAHLRFEGLFLADTKPKYQLGLACITHNFTLRFDVDHRYELVAYIHDEQARAALLAALNLGRGGNAFKTGEFMQQIDAALPITAWRRDRAQPSDLARFRRHVEEADKIYLCGWRDNNAYGTRVSQSNLDKTRAWIDEATYQWCATHNISTRWTDDPALGLASIDKPNWTQYP